MTPLPRDHGDYTQLDKCPCILCTDYRLALSAYRNATDSASAHKPTCRCAVCTHQRKLKTDYFATDSRRTLWSEATYLVADYTWQNRFLTWLERRILDDSWTVTASRTSSKYFWIHDSEELALRWWVERWYEETSGADTTLSADKILSEDFKFTSKPQKGTPSA